MATINFFDSNEVQWKDIDILISGAKVAKVKHIKYGVKMEKKPLHAAGDKPHSIQAGNKSYEGSITVLKSALDAMNLAARAAGGDDITDISCDIVVVYKNKGARGLQTDTCLGVEFSEYAKDFTQGATEMECVLPFIFLDKVEV